MVVAQDPQQSSEYAADIFRGLLAEEGFFLPKPDYMSDQTEINAKMCAIVVDWLVEVHMKYRLRPETLFLTVSIIDRYLSERQVARHRLQLLGVTAMFIASKYEEIHPPRAREWVYITDHTYTLAELLSMEASVLLALNYQVGTPTVVHMLDRLQQASQSGAVQRSLVQYALELSLVDVRFSGYLPSVLASAALMMSNEFLGREQVWPETMARLTRHSEASLHDLVTEMQVLMRAASSGFEAYFDNSGHRLEAVRRKFQLARNNAVANLSPQVAQRNAAISREAQARNSSGHQSGRPRRSRCPQCQKSWVPPAPHGGICDECPGEVAVDLDEERPSAAAAAGGT